MTPPDNRPLSRREYQELIEELAGTNAALRVAAYQGRSLKNTLRELTAYTRKKRRLTALLLAFGIIAAIHLHEISRNVCGGHKLDIADSRPSQATVVACDVLWPESPTEHGADWPTNFNLLGFGLYFGGGVWAVAWYRRTKDVPTDLPPISERELQERGYDL